MLSPWTKSGKLICAGGFDGGFYSNLLATRLRWVTSFPEDHVKRHEEQREFLERHNDFVRTIRGPIAEGGFAVQVNNLKIFSERWRFDFSFHDEIYNLAQALLNINRHVQREEDVEIEEEEATDSPLLCYAPTLLSP